MSVATIQFIQGGNIGTPGWAMLGSIGTTLTIQNSENTGVNSWEIVLLWKPPGSPLSVGTLAFSDNGNSPIATVEPSAPGSYRFGLQVWDAPNRVGRPTNQDIRVFSIPHPLTGRITPPYQAIPRPLPPVESGLAIAKESEMNFDGVGNGWSMDFMRAIGDDVASKADSAPITGTGTQPAIIGNQNFANSNGFSFGLMTNGAITGSYTVPSINGLISAIRFSAGTTSTNATALLFSNSNNISFGINGATITGSASFAAQTNQTIGIYALGNTTGQSSSSAFDARTISFQGAGIASVGHSNGSVIISVPAGAPSPVNFSAGTTSGNLGSVVFSNANGISFGLDGATITASNNAADPIKNFFKIAPLVGTSLSSLGQNSIYIDPFILSNIHSFTNINMLASFNMSAVSSSTTVTHRAGLTMDFALYARSITDTAATNYSLSTNLASLWSTRYTLSGAHSATSSSISTTYAFNTGMVNSTSYGSTTSTGTTATANHNNAIFTGQRILSVPMFTTLNPGDYWIACRISTSAAGGASSASVIRMSNIVMNNMTNGSWGAGFGIATSTSQGIVNGLGVYSVTSSAFPGSIPLNAISNQSNISRYYDFEG